MKRDVFKAIADPTRRKIIDLLFQQTMTLNAIADQFHISRPAISKHIKILTDCGLIIIKQEGRERYCTAQSEPLREVSRWTKQYKSFRAKNQMCLTPILQRKRWIKKVKRSNWIKPQTFSLKFFFLYVGFKRKLELYQLLCFKKLFRTANSKNTS